MSYSRDCGISAIVLLVTVIAAAPARAIDADPCKNHVPNVDPILRELDVVERELQPEPANWHISKASATAVSDVVTRARTQMKGNDVCLARILNESAVALENDDAQQSLDLITESYHILLNAKTNKQLLWEVASNLPYIAVLDGGKLLAQAEAEEEKAPKPVTPPNSDPMLVLPHALIAPRSKWQLDSDQAPKVADDIERNEGVDYEGIRSATGFAAEGAFLGPGAGVLFLDRVGKINFTGGAFDTETRLAQAVQIGDDLLPPGSAERARLHYDYGVSLADIGKLTGDPRKFERSEQEIAKGLIGRPDIDQVELAYVLSAEGKFAQARSIYSKFSNRSPGDDAESFVNRTTNLALDDIAVGDIAAAEASIHVAINNFASSPRALTGDPLSPDNSNVIALETDLAVAGAYVDAIKSNDPAPLVGALTRDIAIWQLLNLVHMISIEGGPGRGTANTAGEPGRFHAGVTPNVKAASDKALLNLELNGNAVEAASEYAEATKASSGTFYEKWAVLGEQIAQIWNLKPGATCPGFESLTNTNDVFLTSQANLALRSCAVMTAANPDDVALRINELASTPKNLLIGNSNLPSLAAAEFSAGNRNAAFDIEFLEQELETRGQSANLILEDLGERNIAIREMQRLVAMTLALKADDARLARALEIVWRVKQRPASAVGGEGPGAARQLAAVSAIADFLISIPSAQLARPQWQHLDKLLTQARDLEKASGASVPSATPPTLSLAAVQKRLPARGALLEFVRYPVFDLKSVFGFQSGVRWDYAVAILKPGGNPRWHDLGPAPAIDDAVSAIRANILPFAALSAADSLRAKPSATASRELFDLIIKPLMPELEGVDTLLIAPDGTLSLLPFPALADSGGHYLVERFKLAEVDSGADFADVRPFPAPGPAAIFAAPDFGRGGVKVCGNGPWEALNGAKDEAQQISPLLGNPQVFVGSDAKKSSLFALHGPRVLHIATHGYFCGSGSDSLASISTSFDDPLLRSALVFAGANAPLSDNANAIATALEVSALDLHGTELVVLSACETGLGDIEVGQGVLGMHRALSEAGAQSEILTLWKTADSAPARFMSVFYRGVSSGKSRIDAFHQAELDMLRDKESANPFFWAGFALYGQWGPMN